MLLPIFLSKEIRVTLLILNRLSGGINEKSAS